MGAAGCCAGNVETTLNRPDGKLIYDAEGAAESMSTMNILEFERRCKMFAYPINKGFINRHQLMEAFKDSIVFNNLYTENHVEDKFFTCPFIADFPIGSMLDTTNVT